MMTKLNARNRSLIHLPARPPFEHEQNNTLQTRLVFVTIVAVVVLWIGVLVSLGHEIIQRVYG